MAKKLIYLLLGILLLAGCDGNKPSAPPSRPISIISPANDANVSDTVTIAAVAGAGYHFDSVYFYVDTAIIFVDSIAPFSYRWWSGNYLDSSYHWLKVEAFGSTTAADSVKVRVIIPGGPLLIVYPITGAIVSDTITIKARQAAAYSFDSVLFKANGVAVGKDTTAEVDSTSGLPLEVFSFRLNVGGYQDNSTIELSAQAYQNGFSYISAPVAIYIMFDISHGQFEFLSTFAISAPAQRVATEGGHLCAALGSSGVLGIDVSLPSSPQPSFTSSTNGFAYGVDLVVPYMIIAEGDYGIERFDISDPNNLLAAGAFNTAGISRNAKISGNLIFVADQDALQIVRISGNNITPASRLSITGGVVVDVDALGSMAFVVDYAGVTAVDASSASSPIARSRFTGINGQARSVSAIDTFVFLGTSAEIIKLSCADPDSLRFISRISYSSGITGVFATDSVLFASIGGTSGGVAAIAYRNQAAMTQIHQYVNNDNCRDICAAGPFVYLAGQTKIDILRFVR